MVETLTNEDIRSPKEYCPECNNLEKNNHENDRTSRRNSHAVTEIDASSSPDCSICLEPALPRQGDALISCQCCGQPLHLQCALELTKNQCPTCRQPIYNFCAQNNFSTD